MWNLAIRLHVRAGRTDEALEIARDKDGAIDLEELRSVLRTLDPDLLRWAAALMKRLDANQDGKLSSAELQPPTAEGTPDAGTPPDPSR